MTKTSRNALLGTFAIVFLLINTVCSFSQIELKAKGGAFETLIPWEDDYLGVIETQAIMVMPKSRVFQCFDQDGNLKWKTKVVPFNFNNHIICDPLSKYAYLVNFPFGNTALAERKSKTEFINVHQVNKKGELKEKSFPYKGELEKLGENKKNLKVYYMSSHDDGLVLVASTDRVNFLIVKIGHDFELSVEEVQFEWDYNLWKDEKISKVKYSKYQEKLVLVQLKDNDKNLETIIKTFDLEKMVLINDVTNYIDKGFSFNSDIGTVFTGNFKAKNFTYYYRETSLGDKTVRRDKLGSIPKFQLTEKGLFMYTYFNINVSKPVQEGLLLFKMNIDSEKHLEPVKKFVFSSEKKESKSHSFLLESSGKFIYIVRQSKNKYKLHTSEGEEHDFEGKLTFAEVYLTYITGTSRAKSDIIQLIMLSGDEYVSFDFDGPKNYKGNMPKAVVYRTAIN